MKNSTISEPTNINKSPDSVIGEVYQLQLRLSTGKFILPRITEIAQDSGISRQSIYHWATGNRRSQQIAKYFSQLTGVTFPDKLEGPLVNAVKTLLRICERPRRYKM